MNFRQKEFLKFISEVILVILLSFASIMHLIRWGAGGSGLSPAYSKMLRSSDERADDAWERMNAARYNMGRRLVDSSQNCPTSIRMGCLNVAHGATFFFGLHE